MKRFLLLLILLSLGSENALACDFCNCLSGLNPFHTRRDALSLTFLSQHSVAAAPVTTTAAATTRLFRSTHAVPTAAGPTEEQRKTVELSYQTFITERFFASAILPLTSMTTTTTASRTIAGNGDLTLLGQYVVNDPLLDDDASTIILGAGVKVPTGDNSSKDANGRMLEQREQLGSGTFDAVLHAAYMTTLSSVTAGIDLSGKVNSPDGSGSRMGHSLSVTVHGASDLYRDNPSEIAVIGIAGLRYELAGKDVVAGTRDPDSGVQSLYGNVGLHVMFTDLRWTASYLYPLLQHRSASAPDEHPRWVAGVQYAFPSLP